MQMVAKYFYIENAKYGLKESLTEQKTAGNTHTLSVDN